MIKIAEFKHVDSGVELLEQHKNEFEFGQFDQDNREYYKGLLHACVKDKTVIVSENINGVIDGVLLGIKIPNLLNPYRTQLHILLTWVHPDKRGSSIFYRMNKKLEETIKNHKEVKDIIYYSIPETNINFNKLNYKEFQSMYKKEI
jgi:hypothetical protein